MAPVRQTQIHRVIKEAFRLGFSVDKENGVIFGRSGHPLTLSLTGKQRYPCVTLYLPTMKHVRANPSFAVHAHKVMAYALWGDKAFTKGMEVRHLNGVMDIREVALALGTAHENMMDIPPKIRQRAAKIARASQGQQPANFKIEPSVLNFVKRAARKDVNGDVSETEISRLAKKFGLSKLCIKSIFKRKSDD